MKKEYVDWISANVPSNGYGKCAEVTTAMVEAFPELRRVRGHYYCWAWGEREHWWLETEDGGVVDPTAEQFPSKGSGKYVEWDESRTAPTGKCPNCGGHCYDHKCLCSDRCEAEYRAYLQDCMR